MKSEVRSQKSEVVFVISCPDKSDLEKTDHKCFNSKSFYFPYSPTPLLPYSPTILIISIQPDMI
ncbi:MAG: hypothetical protein F6K54_14465 [Okeania sp. SIO3B5]|nr:hypothetical protein [Okeania sp. SIO3B5]